jgi:hypothetical protein
MSLTEQDKKCEMEEEEVDEKELEISPEDYEPYVDPIGVTHWLPPKRCLSCGD